MTDFSPAIQTIFNTIDTRLVGGCVRDTLLGTTPKDFDFATPLHYEEVSEIFKSKGFTVVPTGVQHGTVTVVIDNEPFEITTLRKDVETDGRHAVVKFVSDWREDAERRDFTFNALYMDKDGTIYDYYNGVEDLMNKKVKFVGSANDRIQEDALRILRYYRFACRFQAFNTDDEATQAIANNVNLVKDLSAERILMEMTKIFNSDAQHFAIAEMRNNGLDKIIFGENGFNNYYDYTQEVKPSHLYSFALIANEKDYMRKFKASSEEIDFINKVLDQETVNPTEHKVREMLFKKYSPEMIQAKALLSDFGAIETHYEIPVLPVKGQDFLDMGYKGIKIGEKMREATEKWIKSDFKLTKSDLVSSSIQSENSF